MPYKQCILWQSFRFLAPILSEMWIIIYDFWSSPTDCRQQTTDNRQQTDRKRYIWAHRANCTGELNKCIEQIIFMFNEGSSSNLITFRSMDTKTCMISYYYQGLWHSAPVFLFSFYCFYFGYSRGYRVTFGSQKVIHFWCDTSTHFCCGKRLTYWHTQYVVCYKKYVPAMYVDSVLPQWIGLDSLGFGHKES